MKARLKGTWARDSALHRDRIIAEVMVHPGTVGRVFLDMWCHCVAGVWIRFNIVRQFRLEEKRLAALSAPKYNVF